MNKKIWIIVGVILLGIILVIFLRKPSGPTMQMRVQNASTVSFDHVWLGVGGNYASMFDGSTTAYGSIKAGGTSEYREMSVEYYAYGSIEITSEDKKRLPRIVIPGPDQAGPVFKENAKYTLVYDQVDGTWQVRFEED